MSLLSDRINLIRDAAEFKKTSRIPTHSNYWTYMVLDAGYKLGEALYDYKKMKHAIVSFHEKYEFDYYNYTGVRNPFAVTKLIDGQRYIVDDVRDTFNIVNYQVMNEDEYPLLAKDPKKFVWETAIPRKCKALTNENAFEVFKQAAEEFDKYNAFGLDVKQTLLNTYSVPINQCAMVPFPYDLLFNQMRGITGFSKDIRKRPEQVRATAEALMDFNNTNSAIATMDKPMPDTTVFGAAMVFLAHSVMSYKQFGYFYWPMVQKVIDKAVATGRKLHVFSESYIGRFADYFAEVPKGTMVIQPEQDDLFELRKSLPDIALAGGMPSVLLGHGTKEKCLDYAKKLVDELGANGGFIMGQDKMMTFKNDAKPENIIAVQEFCLNYKG